VSPLAAVSVLGPKLGEFARTCPDVVLDITTDEAQRGLRHAEAFRGLGETPLFRDGEKPREDVEIALGHF
jgi:hypothetical protein